MAAVHRDRIPTYNALKGIAALLILFSHMTYLSDAAHPFWRAAWSGFMRNGALVTTLFFLFSGFFLDYTWQPRAFGAYIRAKLRRIYPLTLIVFLFALAVDLISGGSDVVSEGVPIGSAWWFFNILANLLLFKAFIPAESTFYSFHGPSWYISALFAFYLIAYPFVRGLRSDDECARRRWRRTTAACVCVAFASELLICILTKINEWPSRYLCYICPWFRIFGEGFVGILLCEGMDAIQHRLKGASINALETGAVLLFALDLYLRQVVDLNIWRAWIQTLPMGCLLIAFRSGKGIFSRALKARGAQWLGNISFELYLTHAFVYEGLPVAFGMASDSLHRWLMAHAGTRFLITFAASLLLAQLTHIGMRVLDRRLFPPRQSANENQFYR